MKNYYEIDGNIVRIRIDSKKYGTKWVLIDVTDLAIMPRGHIGLNSKGYARYWDGKSYQQLHRLIMGFPEADIDHKNGNQHDNCRSNLRKATESQNGGNRKPQIGCSSRFKGVHWHKARGRWRARIAVNWKRHHIGHFTDEIEAAKAYDREATRYFGEFARLNFPDKKEEYLQTMKEG